MSRARPLRAVAAAVATGWSASLLAVNGYELSLLRAARRPDRRPVPPSRPLRFTILVPAHDEEPVLARTIGSLRALRLGPHAVRLVVLADNCTDGTAAVARALGTEVWERHGPPYGKGPLLSWALERLLAAGWDGDAVVLVDADCRVSPELLAAFARELSRGALVVQARYAVANATTSAPSALRAAGFDLVNFVRPLGRARLGASAGLYGTGICLTREALLRVPWQAHSLAEDLEQYARLALAGIPVRYAQDAAVWSDMPATYPGSHDQQVRWEAGRTQVARRYLPRLLRSAVTGRDVTLLHVAAELALPSRSAQVAGAALAGALALAAGRPAAVALAAATLAGQAGVVVGGLRLAGTPPEAYRALASLPLLLTHRARVLGHAWARPPADWVRTERP